MTDFNWRQLDIRRYAVGASLAISFIIFMFPLAHTPNDDAYTYIRTADIFLNQGLAAAYQHYTWASYAVLIGLTSKLGLELFTAAYLINALFYALLVYSFVSIVREMHSSQLTLLLAAIVILVYPQLNEYRAYVIRDIGFWALSLYALWMYLLFARTGTLRYAVAFCTALLVATTLRPEALFYLFVTPFALLLDQRFEPQDCHRRFLQLIGLVGSIGLIVLVSLGFAGVNVFTLLVEFVRVYQPFLVNTFNPDSAQADAIGTVLFGEHATSYSQEYIGVFMAAGLMTILIANLFNAIGGPYMWVLVYGAFQKQWRMAREVAVPVFGFMLTNAVVLLGFLFITRYLSGRYAIMFCLMLALLVPQIIAYYLQNKSAAKRRTANLLVAVFLTYCAIDAYISFGDSKRYVYDAIEWIDENSNSQTALVTNNQAIAYFTGKVVDYDATERDMTVEEILATAPGDLVAVEMNYALSQLLRSPAIADVFERELVLPDADEERIAVYRRIAP